MLALDERLVVFASGKDFVVSNGELHTNFRLRAGGELLALADPEGTFVHGFIPAFPPQARDVSYGLAENVQVTRLVTSEAATTALIPTDGSLAATWTGGDEPFDETNWASGTTGVGYDTGQIGGAISPPVAYWTFDELIHGGTTAPDEMGRCDGFVSGATLTSGRQGRFGETLSLDGDNDYVSPGVVQELVAPSAFSISLWFRRMADHSDAANETSHSMNNVLIAQSASGSNDNLEIGTEADGVEVYLDTAELGGSIAPVRQPASVQNDTWHHLAVSYDSSGANELKLYVDGALISEHSQYGGLVSSSGTSPFSIGLARPGQNEWGDFEGLIDDVAIWDAALDAEHVSALFGGTSPLLLSGYETLIGLDVGDDLAGSAASTSAYVRVPFTVANPASFDLLSLRMQYDDAFVAYVNGTEVARSNVTGVPQWNTTADSDRPDTAALFSEEFFIPNTPGLINNGPNLLAVQVLNRTADATRLVVLPELEGTPLPDSVLSFMDTPTPGKENLEGLPRLMNPPTFLAASGTFTDNFLLELATDQPGGEVRYTTDGQEPSESSLLYAGPIDITGTTQIRARVFGADSVPSDVVSETYIKLDSDLEAFSSDLPILVLENFGRGTPGRAFQDAFLAVFEPDETGRSRLTSPVDVGSRIGVHVQGNSSANFPKPGYRVELRDETDQDRAIELIGLPAESDFILKGPYEQDRTLIKNSLAHELSRQIGHYAPRTRFVELYARFSGGASGAVSENHYHGVYALTERIKADQNRVDIERLSSKQNTEPEVTGGYMFKIDPPGSDFPFTTSRGSEFVLFEPDPPTSEQQSFIRNHINKLEAALYGPDFTDPEFGYQAYIDVDSFINESMIRSLARQVFSNSTYLFKDRGGKVSFGPVWDFNSAFMQGGSDLGEHHTWYSRLFRDLNFAQQWVDRWQELRGSVFTIEHINATVDGMAAEVAEAQIRNFEQWPLTRPLPDYVAEISRLKDWLARRLEAMDNLVLASVAFNKHGGVVPVGFEATLSAPIGTIYYTLDGSDPRAPGGEIGPQAIEYNGGPIVIDDTTRILTRTRGEAGGDFNFMWWSAPVTGDFVISNGLVVSEIQYNPHGASSSQGELVTDDDDFEYIELSNTGSAPIELDGIQFVQVPVGFEDGMEGIEFTFAAQTLSPDEQIVVVKNRAAFQSRYGLGPRIADGDDGMGGNNGEFSGQLGNGGQQISLRLPSGVMLFSFAYDDGGDWPARADGDGSSLEVVDLSLVLGMSFDPNAPSTWRSSVEHGGSPGAAGVGTADSVVINEILTNTDAPVVDAIELFNPTGDDIDLSGCWLSDRLDHLDRYLIPAGTVVPAGGYHVFDQTDFGFGLNGDKGEDVVLMQPDDFGNPGLFIDHVTFGAALTSESLGRWPDETGMLYPMISKTLDAANSGPRIGPVVISEIMYNPSDSAGLFDPQLIEFVEIFNPTPRAVDLTEWMVDGTGYQFPSGTTLGPGQVAIVVPFNPEFDSSIAAAFEDTYDVDIAANLSSYFGPYPGRLSNAGETVTLLRVNGLPSGQPEIFPRVIEDQVSYDELIPWPTIAGGTGQSLQRTRIDLWGNEAENWISGLPSPGRYGINKNYIFLDSTQVIGETGRLTDLTHESRTITLTQVYTNPVVFAQPASFLGPDPVVVRVNDVQSNQFNLFLAEPSDQNGLHNTEESVSYLVLEAGSHWLSDGTHLEVGTVDTNATVSLPLGSRTWETVSFASVFAEDPVVITQTQTVGGEAFLSTRQQTITTDSFQMALEPEELVETQQGVETVGYVAIDGGTGTWNGMNFRARMTFASYRELFQPINFGQTHTAIPSFIASIASYNGADNSHLRFDNADLNSVDVKIEEDTTRNAEIVHGAAESIAYLAIGGAGLLTAATTPPADGLTQTFKFEITDTGNINDLDVMIDLVHTHVDDLDVFLESPDGTLVELLTDVEDDSENFTTTTLDDEAAESISTGESPFSGEFQPEGFLRDFDGKEITGTWRLHVTDDTANGETGALLNWILNIELGPNLKGNLNHDGVVDADDIDLVFANLGSDSTAYDLDRDGDSDLQDVDHLVLNVMGKRFSDTDLDQDVDISDLNRATFNFNPLGHNLFNGWAQGNFNGDNDVDISDIMHLVRNYAPLGYETVRIAAPATAMTHVGLPAAELRDAEQVSSSPPSSRGGVRRLNIRSLDAAHPLDGENYSADEHFVVDHYFRSSRRRPIRATEHRTTSSMNDR